MKKKSLIKINKAFIYLLFIALIIIVCVFYVKVKLYSPAVGVVDGVYRNDCCANIVIKEPKIYHGKQVVAIKISNMKFGLTGVAEGKFTIDGIQKSDENTWIAFCKENGNRELILPVDNKYYKFKRNEK